MDYSMITGVTAIDGLGNTRQINKSEVTGKTDSIFDSILNSAISNIDINIDYYKIVSEVETIF